MFNKYVIWSLLKVDQEKINETKKYLQSIGYIKDGQVTKKGLSYLNSNNLNFVKVIKQMSVSAITRLLYVCISELYTLEQYEIIEDFKTKLNNRNKEDWD